MSEELIRRSDAINLCEKWRNRTNEHHDKDGWYIAVTLLNAIKELPSADRPSGEWIDNGDRYFRCSLCGTKDTDRWHWCHGCGARMKGADDE